MLWLLRIGWLLWVSAEDAAEFPEEDGVLVLSERLGRHLEASICPGRTSK